MWLSCKFLSIASSRRLVNESFHSFTVHALPNQETLGFQSQPEAHETQWGGWRPFYLSNTQLVQSEKKTSCNEMVQHHKSVLSGIDLLHNRPSNHDQLHHHQLQWWREEQNTNTVAKNKLWKERRMRLCLVYFSFWETTT